MPKSKRLLNAPLVYVLAQVRTTPILKIADFVPEIQERLRKEYPRLNQQTTQALSFSPGATTPTIDNLHRWEFMDKAGTTGFILDNASLVLHTTDYPTFEPFIERLREGLTVLGEVVGISLVERLGLRYVDLIQDENGAEIDKYVPESLRGIPLDDVSVDLAVTRTESKARTAVGQINVKYVQHAEGTALPADLMPLSLTFTKIPAKGKLFAHLDIDHFQTESIDFIPEDIVQRMWSLHDGTSKVFKAAVTGHALSKWR